MTEDQCFSCTKPECDGCRSRWKPTKEQCSHKMRHRIKKMVFAMLLVTAIGLICGTLDGVAADLCPLGTGAILAVLSLVVIFISAWQLRLFYWQNQEGEDVPRERV